MERNLEPLSLPQLQEDRISVLPDDILVDIVSTLKFEEAAQTSVLSHRWLNLWRHVQRLHFGCTKHQLRSFSKKKWKEARPVFVNWVNRVLQMHQSSNLQEFRIFFDLDGSYQKEIDKWLHYALDKRIQSLELNLSEVGRMRLSRKDSYNFSNQPLSQTAQNGVQNAARVDFSRLKALSFTSVNITGEAIEWLLLICPLLEDLRVVGSAVLANLVVSGPSLLLKHLEITSCSAESITISNTNLVSLKVTTSAKRRVLLMNLPMLIDIDVWMLGVLPDKNILFSSLSCCLSQLTVLTLRAHDPKDIMDLYKLPEFPNLKRMVLEAKYCGDTSIIGLTSLIDSCPRLVEFALMVHPYRDDDDLLTRRRMQKKVTGQNLKNLKVFEFHGYHGNTYESELILFFIENSVALEKIVIDPHRIHDVYLDGSGDEERTENSRRHAKEKFKGLVPQYVDLVIP